MDTVTETEYELSDSETTVDTQEKLISVVNNCEVLKHYAERMKEAINDTLRAKDEAEKAQFVEDAIELAGAYDQDVDVVIRGINELLDDIEDRLSESGIWKRLRRQTIGRFLKRD